jgi:ribosomal protein L37AE/L43A
VEKYGVEQAQDEKTAEMRKTEICPDCSEKLRPTTTTGVLMCPKCGTKPFEQASK